MNCRAAAGLQAYFRAIKYGTHLLAITASCRIDPAPGQLPILAVWQDWVIFALG